MILPRREAIPREAGIVKPARPPGKPADWRRCSFRKFYFENPLPASKI
jgi:hypothetical protein